MVFHGGKTRSLGWLKPRFPRGTNRLFTEGNFPQLVRSIQGALESSFHSKTMTRERLVSFTRPVFWLTVPADKKRLRSSLSMTAMEKKKGSSPTFLFLGRSRIAHATFCPWSLIGEGKSERMLLTEGVRTLCTFDDLVRGITTIRGIPFDFEEDARSCDISAMGEGKKIPSPIILIPFLL